MHIKRSAIHYNIGYDHDSSASRYEADPFSSDFKRATSYTTVNVDDSVQGNKSIEYFFASDARYFNEY